MEVAQRYQDRLEEIKTNVKLSYEAFKSNYDRYNEFRVFIFETSLTSDDVMMLNNLSKPQLEFNICEAYISRLVGEFSKQEPSIAVSAQDQSRADPQTIKVVDAHMRHELLTANANAIGREVYIDLLSGGFSSFKVHTEYANEMSFDQNIIIDRVFDPTLVGYDQLARKPDKSDGRFAFELFPMEVEEFKKEYPNVRVEKIGTNRSFSGFSWSYLNGNTQIILVCDYYEKKKKYVKIVQLQDGKVIPLKEYEDMVANWNDIAMPPAIMGKPRKTCVTSIVRYRCMENEVLEYVETDFKNFPLIYVDGNSAMLKNPKNSGNVRQFTRPYVYHVKGAQRLKNFAGITLANEIENIVQHKFMVAKEALPKEEDWLQAYKDIQKPSTMVYNAYMDQDADKPINNPIQPIPRVAPPPEVMQTFAATDSLLQNILGSYDASLGINDNQLSGVAIVEGATQSNAAAMPYIVNYLQGLQSVAEMLLDLIPKYYKTPRTIPVMGIDGKRSYTPINQQNGILMKYETNALNVRVEAGVSYAIQRSKALQQIIALTQANPLFAQFMGDVGLPVLLDNIEIRGIDQLKEMVGQWMEEQKEMKKMAMQQQQQEMQNNPNVIKAQVEMQKLQQKQQEMQMNAQQHQGQFAIDMQKLRSDQMKVLMDALIAKSNNETQMIKAETERFAKQAELQLKHHDMQHQHSKDVIDIFRGQNQSA